MPLWERLLTAFVAPHALDYFESLIYVLEYLVRRHLPWSHLTRTKGEDYKVLLKLRKPRVPENVVLSELVRYTRGRSDGDHLTPREDWPAPRCRLEGWPGMD